jgi:hypothetical protein
MDLSANIYSSWHFSNIFCNCQLLGANLAHNVGVCLLVDICDPLPDAATSCPALGDKAGLVS